VTDLSVPEEGRAPRATPLPVGVGLAPPADAPPGGENLAGERARIASYYRQREAAGFARRYSLFQRGSLFRMQRFERDLLAALARHRLTDLGAYRILDVGCGDGGFLRRLVSWGADPGNLAGVDLLADRVATARRIEPCLDVRQADASTLPFDDASFDLVCQLTVFTSILDDTMRQEVAREMARVLRPGGVVVSYDFRVTRDRRNTRPLRAAELVALFPGFTIDARRVTLIPPLARALAGRSWMLCELLEAIPLLRTHELVLLGKPHESSGHDLGQD
jgi:ubiquinone/menaquinone biosynthesis C-methylase UbiE